MGRLFLIGGGNFIDREIKKFDDFLISKVKKNPNIVYLPTASQDKETNINNFKNIYQQEYNANVFVITLTKNKYSFEQLKDKILNADIIYVGGGNTKYMLDIWKENHLVDILIEAYKKNIILAGISAGAIVWFKGAYTDYSSFEYNFNYYNFKLIEGIGLINMNCCPHYDVPGKEEFNEIGGIALENNSALYIDDENYLSLTIKGASVYYIKDRIIELKDGNLKCLN